MRKIIKHGKIKQMEATCSRCECIFLFEKEDICQTSSKQFYVYCPECNKKIKIYNNNKISSLCSCHSIDTYKKYILPSGEEIFKCKEGECTCSK